MHFKGSRNKGQIYAARLAGWIILLPILLAAIQLPGCSDKNVEGPVLLSLLPNTGLIGKKTEVSVMGRNFNPLIKANFQDKEKTLLSTQFRLWLGKTPLLSVRYVDATQLETVIPAGLPLGSYALKVIDPRGQEGTLPDAFAIREPPPPDTGTFTDAAVGDGSAEISTLDLAPPDDLSHAETTVEDQAIVDHLFLPDSQLPDTKPPAQVNTVAGTGIFGFNDGPVGSAQFANPTGVVANGSMVYIADFNNHRIRTISGGAVSTLAGTGAQSYEDGPGSSAKFNFPTSLAVDTSGIIYVADSANDRIRTIAPDGTVSTFAGSGTKGAQDGNRLSAQFNLPRGVIIEGQVVYVADSGNHRIRRIANDQVSTYAGSPNPADDNQGFVDGDAATAKFDNPVGLALSGDKLYVADSGNNRIRLVENGTVSTFAGNPDPGSDSKGVTDGPLASATFWNPIDLALKGSTLYVVDQSNHRIRVIEGNQVTTLCGLGFGYQDGVLSIARFYYPHGIAVGPSGELYIADQSNHRIRVIIF